MRLHLAGGTVENTVDCTSDIVHPKGEEVEVCICQLYSHWWRESPGSIDSLEFPACPPHM